MYHIVFNPPKDPEVAARLVQRSDDNEATMKNRLEIYRCEFLQTSILYFRKSEAALIEAFGKYVYRVNGDRTVADISAEVLGKLEKVASSVTAPNASSSKSPVTTWLESIGLGQYSSAFLAKGYDDPIVLPELDEHDMEQIGVLPGHR